MSEVTVYQFRRYDIGTDENRKSRRWGNLDAIAQVGGHALKDTATEVDGCLIGTEIPGLTERDFNPHNLTGIQRAVTR